MAILISHPKSMSLDLSVPAIQMHDGIIKTRGSRLSVLKEQKRENLPINYFSTSLIGLTITLKTAIDPFLTFWKKVGFIV